MDLLTDLVGQAAFALGLVASVCTIIMFVDDRGKSRRK